MGRFAHEAAAIDPLTGRALPWNPTKSRNHGTMVLYATPAGLWVGSDGENFGREYHAGIGFAPLQAGPTDTTRPNTFIDSGPSGSVTDTSATFGFSASEPSTFECRLDGGAWAACESGKAPTDCQGKVKPCRVPADMHFLVTPDFDGQKWTDSHSDSNLRRFIA